MKDYMTFLSNLKIRIDQKCDLNKLSEEERSNYLSLGDSGNHWDREQYIIKKFENGECPSSELIKYILKYTRENPTRILIFPFIRKFNKEVLPLKNDPEPPFKNNEEIISKISEEIKNLTTKELEIFLKHCDWFEFIFGVFFKNLISQKIYRGEKQEKRIRRKTKDFFPNSTIGVIEEIELIENTEQEDLPLILGDIKILYCVKLLENKLKSGIQS